MVDAVSKMTGGATATADAPGRSLRDRLQEATPFLVLAPSLLASFVYVFVFTIWTFYISLSDSALLPTYHFVGFDHYISIWANARWRIAYSKEK